jgi:hypothetical protein
MTEPSGEDRERAAVLVQQLFDEDAGALVQTDEDLVIFDVERDLARFRFDLDLLDSVALPAAALRLPHDDELVPVSLSALIGEPLERGFIDIGLFPRRFELPYRLERAMSASAFEAISTEDARRSLLRRATDFLATRMAAVADGTGLTALLHMPRRRGAAPTPTPGCNFAVTTDSHGLRVHWSGSYGLSKNYFGHPTTPVGGVLQAGRYLFGVDGGAYGNDPQWDTSVVVLPGPPHVHLNF